LFLNDPSVVEQVFFTTKNAKTTKISWRSIFEQDLQDFLPVLWVLFAHSPFCGELDSSAQGQRGLWIVQWAADGETAPVEDVSINHGGFDILVAEEFLDGADVVAIFEQVSGIGWKGGALHHR
jgi:hypothetical protein